MIKVKTVLIGEQKVKPTEMALSEMAVTIMFEDGTTCMYFKEEP